MKKFTIMAAFAALVGSASAAAITWGFGGQVNISENGAAPVLSTSYSGDVNWQLALVYVGQNKSTFDIADLTADSVLDSMDYAVSTATKTANKWSPATKKTSTTAFDDGASFAVVLFDGGSFDYVYALSNSSAGEAYKTVTSISDMSARGSGSVFATNATGTAAGVVKVSVPEPGIACMALLGIGMMIKRRKA